MESNSSRPVAYADPSVTTAHAAVEPIAKSSLIAAGLFFLTPIPCLCAVVLGIIGIERTRCKGTRGMRHARWGIIFGLAGIGVWIAAIATLQHHRATARQAGVAADLHRLGRAILLYRNDNRNIYPDSLDRLLSEYMNPAVLASRTLGDQPARGASVADIRKDFQAGGHSSFVLMAGDINEPSLGGFQFAPTGIAIAFASYDLRGKTRYAILYSEGVVQDCDRLEGQAIIQRRLDEIIAKNCRGKDEDRAQILKQR